MGKLGILLCLVAAVLAMGIVGMVLIARECSDAAFCNRIAELLEERLDVEVTIHPMRSHGLVFLECPVVEVADPSGRWALRAEKVNFELLPSSICSGGLGFRSILAPEVTVWMGRGTDGVARDTGGNRGPAEEAGASDGGSLPWWLRGRLRDLGNIPVETVRIAELTVVGPPAMNGGRSFVMRTGARGSVRHGVAHWHLQKGALTVRNEAPWRVGHLRGTLGNRGIHVDEAVFRSPEGAEVTCHSLQDQRRPDLALKVEADGLQFRPTGTEVEETFGPVSETSARVQGVFRAPFPQVHRFRFAGEVQLTGLSFGESKIFRLLAGQTGEGRLRNPEGRKATGTLECTPGVLRLTRLRFVEKDLVKLEGWLSIIEEHVVGVFDLALPAQLVGKIPGGKPKGFSYPASGWSRARLSVEGETHRWKEDLSGRLIAQLSRNVPVKSGPRPEVAKRETEPAIDEAEKRRMALREADRERKQTLEDLFYTLIEP